MKKALFVAFALCAPLPAFAQSCPTFTTIVDIGTVPLQQNTLITVPPTGGANSAAYKVVQLKLLLPTAIKEASGNTLFLEADISTDGGTTWNPAASIDWTSYGAVHVVTLPCVGAVTDPDPTITLPLNGKTNALYRLQYQTNLTSGHPIFSGF